MRLIDPAAQAGRARRAGLIERKLFWIAARNRETGGIEGLGLWDGEDTETILVTDMFSGLVSPRVFQGAGGLLSISAIRHEAGLNIRPVTVSLAAHDPTVLAAIREYDARGARAQIWKRSLSPETRAQLGAVEPWYKGFVNTAPIGRPAPGGQGTVEVELVSSARMLTIASNARKSDEAQRLRAGDRFRRYKAVAPTVTVAWGTRDSRA